MPIKDSEVDFATLKIRDTLVKDMQLLLKGRHDHNRMYVLAKEGETGFVAVVVRFVSCGTDGDVESHWERDDLTVEVEHEIWAATDGVRHHHVMAAEDGYLHYPDLDFHIAAFQELIKLEKKYSPQADRFDEDYNPSIEVIENV